MTNPRSRDISPGRKKIGRKNMGNRKPRTEKQMAQFHRDLAKYRWKKGSSGNPKGRPPRKNFTEMFYDKLQEKLNPVRAKELSERFGGDFSDATFMEAMVEAMVEHTIDTLDLEFFREIGDRLSPKPRRVELEAEIDVTARQTRELSADMTDDEAAEAYRRLTGDPDLQAVDVEYEELEEDAG